MAARSKRRELEQLRRFQGRVDTNAPGRWKSPVMIGIPTLGLVRFEWHNAVLNMVIPMNWAVETQIQPVPTYGPIGYQTAEAQNLIARALVESDKDWLILLEDDVVIPPDLLLKFNEWMMDGRFPVVSGLYHLRAEPKQPMAFRGRGNGAWFGYRPNEINFVDGVPTGCILISAKLIRAMWPDCEEITLRRIRVDGTVMEIKTRRLFDSPRKAGIDPETGGYYRQMGTSDLEWCDRVIDGGYLAKAGFPEIGQAQYPFVLDARITCGHIERSTGRVF